MLQFKIDNDLIEEFKVEFPEKKFFTSFSEIVQFSDEVLDSIKFVSESFLSKKLNSIALFNASCCSDALLNHIIHSI